MRNILLLYIALLPFSTWGQNDSIAPLQIGVKQAPPFVEINKQSVTGTSVEFWEMVNQKAGYSYDYRTYPNIAELLQAVENGEVDMSINPLTVSEERMKSMAFSQPFYISGTAFVRVAQSKWLAFVQNFFTWQFFSAVGVLLLVNLIFGLLIWVLERRRNEEEFRKGIKGLGDGFWWSAVTMTTVGYGDKAPKTTSGKVLGFIWMFSAILMISGLTAGIASALTVSSLEGNIESVEDLRKLDAGTLQASSSDTYLTKNGVQPVRFTSVNEGLKAVADGKIDVFVHDRPILKHYLKLMDNSDLTLSSGNLKIDYYSFGFPRNSELRDELDPAVVGALKSERWQSRR